MEVVDWYDCGSRLYWMLFRWTSKSVVEMAMEALEQEGWWMQGVRCNVVFAKGHQFRHRCSNASIGRTCQFGS